MRARGLSATSACLPFPLTKDYGIPNVSGAIGHVFSVSERWSDRPESSAFTWIPANGGFAASFGAGRFGLPSSSCDVGDLSLAG